MKKDPDAIMRKMVNDLKKSGITMSLVLSPGSDGSGVMDKVKKSFDRVQAEETKDAPE